MEEQKGPDVSQPSETAPAKKVPLTGAQRQAKFKANRKVKDAAESYVYNSKTEPTKTEAHDILKGRGVNHPVVANVVYTALLQAATENGIEPNRFLFANGVVQTLRSREAKQPQPLAEIPAAVFRIAA